MARSSRTLLLLTLLAALQVLVGRTFLGGSPSRARTHLPSLRAVGSASSGRPPPGFSEGFGGFEDSFYKPLDRSGFGKGPVPTATRAWFYARMAKGLRSSRALGTVIRQGETFEVDAELVVTGQKYLKLANQPGWVFTRGLSGDWKGREIAKRSP